MAPRETEYVHRAAPGLEGLAADEALPRLLRAQREALEAVQPAIDDISRLAGEIERYLSIPDTRLVYAGAGTSAMMALSDALELAGTFGIPPARTPVLIAGGVSTLLEMKGHVEDDAEAAPRDVDRMKLGPEDLVLCVSASGATPYTIAVARAASSRGSRIAALVCTPGSELAALADHVVLIATGPEMVAGSTRLGAGTAQKAALGMLSTLAATRLGHVYRGRMVNLTVDNAKLRDRAIGTIAALAGCDTAAATDALDAAGGEVKPAVVAAAIGETPSAARELLRDSRGRLGPILDGAAVNQTKGKTNMYPAGKKTASTRETMS